jgi:hypothetical protein
MGAVRVDMGSMCPFFKGDKQVRGVNQNYKGEANEKHRERDPDRPRNTKPAKSQKAEKEGPHTHPAIMATEATAPPTLETLSAMPAVPPKIACVMLGIKSRLMMKAMKTIVQGIRFASHISIE